MKLLDSVAKFKVSSKVKFEVDHALEAIKLLNKRALRFIGELEVFMRIY